MAVNNVDFEKNDDFENVLELKHLNINKNDRQSEGKLDQVLDNNEESGDDLPGMFVNVKKK